MAGRGTPREPTESVERAVLGQARGLTNETEKAGVSTKVELLAFELSIVTKVGAEMTDLSTEHTAWSDSIIRREALRFLHAQVDVLEAKLRERSTYLAEAYPRGRIPPGEADVMDVYEEEKALVQELIRDCQDKLLPEAVRERSDAARRDVLELSGKETRDAVEARNLRKARRDEAILAEILERWSIWLKAERSPGG